jgi:uncharacterized protein YuzE
MVRKTSVAVKQHDDADLVALEQGATSLVSVAGNATLASEMMGYNLAYNRDRIVQEARFYMGTAGEAMLEAGKRLVLLKEHEQHGEFIRIVEDQLGIPARTAQQMMQAAVKYLSHPSLAANTQTFSLLGKSKMIELMTLDSDILVELSEGGSIAGIKLDEMDRMSVRELKEMLRELRADNSAKDGLLTSKSQLIDKLQTKKAKVKPPTPDEEGAQLRRETSDWVHNAEGIIRGAVRDGLEQLAQHALEFDTCHEEFASGLLAQLQRALSDIGGQLLIKAKPDGDSTPEWMKA